MRTAYTAADWTDLYVASAGASAALTGLLFVAVSVNIQDFLEYAGLPARALRGGAGGRACRSERSWPEPAIW